MGGWSFRGAGALIPARFMRAPFRLALSGWGPGPDKMTSFWLALPGTQLRLGAEGLVLLGSGLAAAFLSETQLALSDVLEIRAIAKTSRTGSTPGLAVLTKDTPWLALWSHQLEPCEGAVHRLAAEGYPTADTAGWKRDFGGLMVAGSPYWQR
jgi:hypothetical protein